MVCRQNIWPRRHKPNGKLKRHLGAEMLHHCFRNETLVWSKGERPNGNLKSYLGVRSTFEMPQKGWSGRIAVAQFCRLQITEIKEQFHNFKANDHVRNIF